MTRFHGFCFLFPGNEGTEFSNKTTLHFNSSSLHHHTLNGSSPTTYMAGFGHLNMNQSRDEKIHNLRAENQGESIRKVSPFKDNKQSTLFLKTKLVCFKAALTLVPTLNNTITTNHPTTSRVLDLEVANATISLPIKGTTTTTGERKKDSHEKISAVDQ